MCGMLGYERRRVIKTRTAYSGPWSGSNVLHEDVWCWRRRRQRGRSRAVGHLAGPQRVRRQVAGEVEVLRGDSLRHRSRICSGVSGRE